MINSSIKYGIIGSVAVIVYMLLLYLTGLHRMGIMGSLWLLLVFVVVIVFVIAGTKAARASNGGFISFKDAFIAALICGFVMSIITTSYNYVHYNYIETDYFDFVINQMHEYGDKMPEDQLEKTTNELLKRKEETKSLNLKNYGYSLIFYVLVALISAVIFQKKKVDEIGPMA
ncbi:MAG: DUF4199 domain-containing protein [Bacteroidetes bacterium]|nr:DUF4199 domain-containing protein [Bacteroidota bacterium]